MTFSLFTIERRLRSFLIRTWGLRSRAAAGDDETQQRLEQGDRAQQEALPVTRRGEVPERAERQPKHEHPDARPRHAWRDGRHPVTGAPENRECGHHKYDCSERARDPEPRRQSFMSPAPGKVTQGSTKRQ